MTSIIFLLVMGGFLAISINAGIMMDTYTQLQAGSDSAALAAAGRLDGTTVGLTNARAAAVAFSNEHVAYGETLIVNPLSDVIFGRWHFNAGDCIATSGDCPAGFEAYSNDFAFLNPGRVTAVRVNNGRDGVRNPVLDLPFGSWVGTTTAAVRSGAVAVSPGSGVTQCALPFGVAVCKLRQTSTSSDMICPQTLYFSNTHTDAIGFVSFDDDPANPHNAAVDINSGLCVDTYQAVGEVTVQNGNGFNQQVINAVQGTSTGNCLIGTEQTMPIIQAECPDYWDDPASVNPQFNQTSQVVGFLRVTIRAVANNQGQIEGCPGEDPPAGVAPTTGRAVIIDINCEDSEPPPAEMGGGEIFNSTAARVWLVQ